MLVPRHGTLPPSLALASPCRRLCLHHHIATCELALLAELYHKCQQMSVFSCHAIIEQEPFVFSSLAVAATHAPRAAGQCLGSDLIGNLTKAVLTKPMKKRPCLLNATAALTDENQESLTTILPEPCQGSVKRSVVAVPAPYSLCHRFPAIVVFPSLISRPIMMSDKPSATVLASHPVPFGLCLIFMTAGIPPEA